MSEAASTWSARTSRRELDLARRCGAPGGGPAAPGGVFQRMRGVADRRSCSGARSWRQRERRGTERPTLPGSVGPLFRSASQARATTALAHRTGCERDGYRERSTAGGEEVLAQGTCLCMTRRLGTNVPSSHPAACRRLAGPPAWLRGQTAARARRWDRMVEVPPSRAPARLPCLLRVRMAALDGSALPGERTAHWAPPWVLRRRRFPRWPSLATAAPPAAPVAAPHAAPCRASAAQARRTS